MPKSSVSLQAFNRGLVSSLALARRDVARVSLSAEVQTNWMPRTLGSMMLRPGTQYLGATKGNAPARFLPFVFSATDTALLELTDLSLRVWVDDALVVRPAVATAVTNGSFTSDVSGWTDADDVGATSGWASGALSLVGNGENRAIRTQVVTVAGGDVSVEHALRVVVTRGRVLFKVGSTAGGEDYVRQTTLYPGEHSLAFTPGGNFHIWIAASTEYASLVDSCTVEAAGAMSIPTPWLTADLQSVRAVESADVVFVACRGYQQRRIERRAARSWSVVLYEVDDGPFRVQNLSPITVTPSALTGSITLTASKEIFRAAHIGGVFRLVSKGQNVSANLAGDNQFTNTIRVVGVGARRVVSVTISGSWSGTITRQRSFDSDEGPWEDDATYGSNVSNTFNDGLDNSIVWYRLGFVTGGYSSGAATAALGYAAGSISGAVRITGYTSGTSVSANVLSDLGALTASDDWSEGEWSEFRGWPSAVEFHDGRLWWAGKSRIWGSVSDAFNSFDDTVEGDSGPISRSIGSGPVDNINWLLSASRLFIGGDATERTVQASSFDEVLTPTNFGMRETSTLGSANVVAIRLDGGGFFVQRGGARVFGLNYDESQGRAVSKDAMSLAPDVGLPGIVRAAVQRLPDTRVHFVRSDGAVAALVYDEAESVNCWVLVETTGVVEDVVVLPGTEEDAVYYVVKRTTSGGDVRYLERWALESEAVGGSVTKLSDAHVVYSGVATSTLTGLSHLEGLTVCVWAEGVDRRTFVVASGAINIGAPTVTSAVIGLPYTAQFKSTKLGEVAQRNRIPKVGVLLANTHAQGLKYGEDFATLDDLPRTEAYTDVATGAIWDAYGEDMFEFNGTWAADMRLCLQAASPRPCTVLGAVLTVEEHAS